jgi:hypothetical protein
MKRLFVLFFVLFSVSMFAQPTVNFDTTGQNFTWVGFANNPDAPGDFTIVANPNPTGINTSANVAKHIVNPTADPWAGVWTDDIPFTVTAENANPTIMVHKDVITNCALKFEGPGLNHEVKVPNTVTGQWEKLTFDFTADIGKSVTRVVFFSDFPDARTAGSTNYWDNLEFIPPIIPVGPPAITFDTTGQNFTWGSFANNPDAPGDFSVVTNPDPSGINTSANVAKHIVNPTADPWAGAFTDDIPFTITAGLTSPSIMVHKPVVSNCALKFEGPGGYAKEVKVPNTVINQWELLVFDFSTEIGKEVTRVVFFPDFPDARTAGSTNYWDNLIFDYVIPVELTSFTASVIGNGVKLNWSTATETNNRGFEIQRSVNNREFTAIDFVQGHGTTTDKREYSYLDNSGAAGTIYYRLKQIDYDGTFEYSQVVEVAKVVSYELSQNYPNPFNPTTTITYSIPQNSFVTLKVYDVLGSEVAELVNGTVEAGIHKINFNAFNLNSGVYFYTIKAGNFNETKKLMLMK